MLRTAWGVSSMSATLDVAPAQVVDYSYVGGRDAIGLSRYTPVATFSMLPLSA